MFRMAIGNATFPPAIIYVHGIWLYPPAEMWQEMSDVTQKGNLKGS